MAAALCYDIFTVGAVDMIFKERLENWLGKGMPRTSANDAPGGALAGDARSQPGWSWE